MPLQSVFGEQDASIIPHNSVDYKASSPLSAPLQAPERVVSSAGIKSAAARPAERRAICWMARWASPGRARYFPCQPQFGLARREPRPGAVSLRLQRKRQPLG
ncbi:hypothetical protein AOLI_G00211360 [Acnodon oligacanthus]